MAFPQRLHTVSSSPTHAASVWSLPVNGCCSPPLRQEPITVIHAAVRSQPTTLTTRLSLWLLCQHRCTSSEQHKVFICLVLSTTAWWSRCFLKGSFAFKQTQISQQLRLVCLELMDSFARSEEDHTCQEFTPLLSLVSEISNTSKHPFNNVTSTSGETLWCSLQ